jgi:hypothetical protein
MRGFGDYHRTLVAEHGDPRLLELFGYLRRALDTFEQIMLRTYQPITETKPQPQTTPQRKVPWRNPGTCHAGGST